jgi:PKD repeat protein
MGVFVINLTAFDDEGMPGSSTKVLMITNSPPDANFSFSPARPTINEPVAFVDRSIDPDGSIVSWLWMFGDGAISTARDSRHTYADRGYYEVILNVTDGDGAQANVTGYVRVIGLPPQADFSFLPSSPTTEDEIAFTDSSRDVDSGIFTWLWDFGDSSTSGLKNTKHRYEKKGRYYVNLTIWDDDGLRASVVRVLNVRTPSAMLAWAVVLLPIAALAFALVVTRVRKRKGTAQDADSNPAWQGT